MKKIMMYGLVAMILFLGSCAVYQPKPFDKKVDLTEKNYSLENLDGTLPGAYVTFSKSTRLVQIPKVQFNSTVGKKGEIILNYQIDGKNDLQMNQQDTVWIPRKVFKKKKKFFTDDYGNPIIEDTEMKIATAAISDDTSHIDIPNHNGTFFSAAYIRKDWMLHLIVLKKNNPDLVKLGLEGLKEDSEGDAYSVINNTVYYLVADKNNDLNYVNSQYLSRPAIPKVITTKLKSTGGERTFSWELGSGGLWYIKRAKLGDKINTPCTYDEKGFANFFLNGQRYFIVKDAEGNEWGLAQGSEDLHLKKVRIIKNTKNNKGLDQSESY